MSGPAESILFRPLALFRARPGSPKGAKEETLGGNQVPELIKTSLKAKLEHEHKQTLC